jgi:hypothetical protein
MAGFGYKYGESDDFLVFIQYDTSTKNLLKKVKSRWIEPEDIVGIFRIIKNKKLIPESKLKKGLRELNRYIDNKLWFEGGWDDPEARKRAVISQRNAIVRHLKARRKL